MADAALAGRPLWVREGAAMLFCGRTGNSGRTSTASGRAAAASCPADAELIRPVSAGALSNAYARAQACFVRELLKRKSWRDIK